jgi:hypothetical protein
MELLIKETYVKLAHKKRMTLTSVKKQSFLKMGINKSFSAQQVQNEKPQIEGI